MLRVREVGPDGGGRIRADLVDGLELLGPRVGEGIEGAEVVGQGLRRLLPNVPDPEGEDQARRLVALALLDLRQQIRRRLLAPALELGEVLRLQVVDRRHVREHPGRHELVDELLAEPLDVHGAPAAEVPQGLPHDGRAGRVDAAQHHLAFLAHRGVAADRTVRGHDERRRAVGPLLEHDPDDFRNDVAAFLDDDRVADPDVLARQVLVVVERGLLDRGAAELNRVEERHRRHGPGAAHVEPDLADHRRRLLGRVLVGERPARRLGGRAEVLLQGAVVDLDDDAVGLEAELVPLLAPVLDEAANVLETLAPRAMGVDRESQLLEPGEGVALGRPAWASRRRRRRARRRGVASP